MPTVSSLDRGLDVLEAVVRHADGVGTRALAKELGISVTSVHNMATTLARRGYLAQADHTRQFVPGPHLALLFGGSGSLLERRSQAAMPLLKVAAETSGESVMLAGFAADRIVRLAFLAGPQTLSVREPDDIGGIAHCTATGKMLLSALAPADLAAFLQATRPRKFTPQTIHKPAELRAELERVRANGFATVTDELSPGISAVAVAVPGSAPQLPAALGISAPTIRYTPALRSRVMKILAETAAGIGAVWARLPNSEPAGRPAPPKAFSSSISRDYPR